MEDEEVNEYIKCPLDMNKKIAEALGEKSILDLHGDSYPISKDGYILDYTTDKALFHDLVEKLGEADFKYYYDSMSKKHIWLKEHPTRIWSSMRGENESLLLATCEAFIEEFCND